MKHQLKIAVLAAIIAGCGQSNTSDQQSYFYPHVEEEVLRSVPEWAKNAVWYQIFVERFRDGDPNNQPQLWGIEGSWPHDKPNSWRPTRWTQDWYAMEDWAVETGKPFYETVQMRRYGGDLQGVIDKLDYLADLGVNVIYFNPLNDAPSLHKYDARNYLHIDIFFGPDPRGDSAMIRAENPANPSTWMFTSADRLFLQLIREARKRDIRVIMDFSWNHTGITFWAWRDVLKNQQDSPYAEWYQIESFDDEEAGTEFSYSGWAGVAELPEFKRHGPGSEDSLVHGQLPGGNLHPELKKHIFAVTRRWLDPMGNGNLKLGVDGFRLDVAELLPAEFWREYRAFVRSINPDAYLVGELWWEDWPDLLLNPNPWLQGDMFDANMNYRWYMPTRSFFGKALPEVATPSEYVAHIDSVSSGTSRDVLYAQMNLTSSHDAPRFMTSMLNRGQYKYLVNPRENPDYILRSADAVTLERMDMVLLKQFTDVGAPHIWMGDEMGMWGADDPDTRKPLIWPDMQFDSERADPFGRPRRPEPVAFNQQRHSFYTEWAALRREYPVLVHGGKTYTMTDDERGILVYERYDGEVVALVIFNNDDRAHQFRYRYSELSPDDFVPQVNPSHDWSLRVASMQDQDARFEQVFALKGAAMELQNHELSFRLPARSGIVLTRQ